MKKNLPRRTSKQKSATGVPKTVEAYLSRLPEPSRKALERVRAAIRSAAPEGTQELISYRIPAFKHQKVLVWYAAFKDHCSLFPTAAVIEEFRQELEGYDLSKGTIQFPIEKPLSSDLVKKLVRARVAHVKKRKKKKI